MPDNLNPIIARRWANGASTVLVLTGAGLAAVLLSVGTRRPRGGFVGLVVLAALVAAALVAESELLTSVMPRLLVRP